MLWPLLFSAFSSIVFCDIKQYIRCKNLQGSLYQTLVFEQQSYLGRLLLYHWALLSTSLALQCPKINKRSLQPVFTSSPEQIQLHNSFFPFTHNKVIVCLKLPNLPRRNSYRPDQVWSVFVCFLKCRMKLYYIIQDKGVRIRSAKGRKVHKPSKDLKQH